MAQDLNP